ncbi:LppP/LprE family lipoprotein [Streptomyces sp. N2-109]|uniref:LppP/LprE family lipoprotein n=1 Tax=Streptomyces gossypii TaxID=2883101 RepID=A0ABT2JQ89_9ACTN|nr:LppP/LprE family lipoprotein [Streptomyces gossypii]MCT2590053.1 LppP/LprE family lipoprotein [Streptomyces gossypii]
MRRLTAVEHTGSRRSALALAVGVLTLVAGCAASGEGVRVEGSPTASAAPNPAVSSTPEGASASEGPPLGSPVPSTKPEPGVGSGTASGDDEAAYTENGKVRKVDETTVISVLRRDPKVSGHVKRDLAPCDGEQYPVGVEYGRMTGGKQADLVVNVSSCADSVGVGTYVYRRSTSGALVNVFAAERPPVSAELGDGGMLVVTRDVYIGDEPICCPSGRDVITYAWRDGVFEELKRERTDSEARATPSVEPRKD